MSVQMSELRGHATRKSVIVGKKHVDGRVEDFSEALQHARTRHVLICFVSPQRMRPDACACREFNLREASAYAPLA